jgi:hypothetical protein
MNSPNFNVAPVTPPPDDQAESKESKLLSQFLEFAQERIARDERDAPLLQITRRSAPRDMVVFSRDASWIDGIVSIKADLLGKLEGLQVRFYGQLPPPLRQEAARLLKEFSDENDVPVTQQADLIRRSTI